MAWQRESNRLTREIAAITGAEPRAGSHRVAARRIRKPRDVARITNGGRNREGLARGQRRRIVEHNLGVVSMRIQRDGNFVAGHGMGDAAGPAGFIKNNDTDV